MPARTSFAMEGYTLDTTTIAARLTLFGFGATPATIEATVRTRSERGRRAIAMLAACWAAIPIVFFIPPHLPWALGAFAAGIFLARRRWIGEYVVHGFDGRCPRCGHALSLKPGSLLRLPCAVTCFHCHHDPWLEPGRPS